jgi:hypothetical protein
MNIICPVYVVISFQRKEFNFTDFCICVLFQPIFNICCGELFAINCIVFVLSTSEASLLGANHLLM